MPRDVKAEAELGAAMEYVNDTSRYVEVEVELGAAVE